MYNSEDKKTYYDVLEITPKASLQEIHDAYNKAKNAYSGDGLALYSLMGQEECEQILEQIEEAYTILGHPEKRREYDLVRGLNHDHTPQGYGEKIKQRPSYSPQNKSEDLLSQTENETEKMQIDRRDFEYEQPHSEKSSANVSRVVAFKKFGLNYSVDEDIEREIENCTQFEGSFLKKVREYKNVTVERMAEMTKISKTHIRHIEDNAIDKLPAKVYTRGFVYQYAKCLKLNPELVASSYMHFLDSKV